jgi:uncharacterized iron-regulated membrane protein
MKLRPRSFRVFWELHAWSGVLASLLVYVMFLAGVPTLFFHELSVWQDPALLAGNSAEPPKIEPLLARWVEEHELQGASRVFIDLRNTPYNVSFADRAGEEHTRLIAPDSGALRIERSGLAQFLYYLHFLYVIPGGMYFAGLLAVALLLALVTGVLIHLKNWVRQLVRFRPDAGLRWASSDAHKVLGVFGLPFQILFAWSGAALCLSWLVIQPAFTATVFRGDAHAAQVAHGHSPNETKPTGRVSSLPNVDALVARAREALPGLRLGWIAVQHVGDEASIVEVGGPIEGVAFGRGEVAFRARDGAISSIRDPRAQPAIARFESWLFGLHIAAFGGLALKLLYAALSLATCAVLVTGNVIWLERRDPQRLHRGNWILERLTIGTAAGLPLAFSALFLANRSIPFEAAARSTIERGVFTAAWLLALALAFWPRLSARSAVGWLLDWAALGFAVVPLLDLAVRPSTLSSPLARGVALGLLVTATACALTARAVRRGSRRTEVPSRPLQVGDSYTSRAG